LYYLTFKQVFKNFHFFSYPRLGWLPKKNLLLV